MFHYFTCKNFVPIFIQTLLLEKIFSIWIFQHNHHIKKAIKLYHHISLLPFQE
jgi:hypothetical protein